MEEAQDSTLEENLESLQAGDRAAGMEQDRNLGGNQTPAGNLIEEQVSPMMEEERRLDSGLKHEPLDGGGGTTETEVTTTALLEEKKVVVEEEGTKVVDEDTRDRQVVEMAEGENEQDSKHNLPSNEKIDPSINNKSTESPEKSQLAQEMELPEAAELLKNMPPASAVDSQKVKGVEPRKKRGRKAVVKAQVNKEEDDVCFVCFDGGDLVLCDQRSCPKAYHLQCIKRDQDLFSKQGTWHCGWHFCCGRDCSKRASIRCYTCPKAYCASCRKQQTFLLLEKSRGLCHECAPLVKMIEQQQSINEDGSTIDFNDRDTYECLFKEYWEDLKVKQSITPPKFDKDGNLVDSKETLAAVNSGGSDSEEASSSDSEVPGEPPLGTIEAADDEDVPYGSGTRKEKKTKVLNALTDEIKCTINQEQKEEAFMDMDVKEKVQEEEPEEEEEQEQEEEDEGDAYQPKDFDGWASKELTRIIKSMNGNTEKPMKRLDVHKLLLEYIKLHELESPRNKSIIRCDDKLQALFGKKKVARRSIMKYMQYHLCYNSKAVKKGQTQAPPEEPEGIDDKRMKLKRKLTTVADSQEYAAINPTNIGLVYLRRALLEDMLGDPQFEQKVSGTFVRIRVPGMLSRNEMCYRLVQIVGIRVQDMEYKAGKKMTNVVLQIMNLHKKEDLTIDLVSNQDFTEDECKRLRQSIRCGFIKAPTVGEFQQKAITIREAKMNDWFETETARLTALRDRANEKGKKRELRECVEKLQRLADPEYRLKELKNVPAFEADPSMDPHYESSDEEGAAAQPTADVPTITERRGGIEPPFKRERRTEHPPLTKQDSFGSHSVYAEPEGRTNGRQHGAPPKPFQEQKVPPPQPPPQVQRPPQLNLQPPPPPPLDMFEREKAWFYQDPTGTVQGPFSFEQLRKWSTTGLFPPDLKIWKSGQSREQGVLLVDALSRQVAFPPPQQQAFTPVQYQPPEITPVAGGGGQQRSPWSREPSSRDSAWDNNNGNNNNNNNNSNTNSTTTNHPSDGYRSSRLQQLKKSTPCRFYQRGYCRNGDACQFQH